MIRLSKAVASVALILGLSTFALAEQSSQIERKYYNPWETEIGYAQAVRVGNRLYLSGVTSTAETIEAQVTEIYSTIESMLKDFGADTSAIVKEVVYTTNMEALKKTIPIRKKAYPKGKYPASTWVEVEGLYLEELMVEVEIEAVLAD